MDLPREPEIYHWIDTPTPLGALNYAGFFVTDQDWGLKQMRSLEFYSLALIIEGGGVFRDENGIETEVKPGDCIVVPPGLTHQYGCRTGGFWKEIYACFHGDAFDPWRECAGLEQRQVFHLGSVDLWLPRWKRIVDSRPRNHFEAVVTLSDIHLLLNHVSAADRADWSFEERMIASRQHLQSLPPEDQPDWELLANECGCSYETWRKGFTKQFNVSPMRYRRAALMRQAGRLMTRTSLSNEELASQFGCSDGFHFSKLFKSVMGVTPQDFRKQVKAVAEGN
ncbi:MAG: AraC family transcriptional regulator [Verrucomicrobiota bacterium]